MKIPFLWVSLGFTLGIVVERKVNVPMIWIWGFLGSGIVALWLLRGKKFFFAALHSDDGLRGNIVQPSGCLCSGTGGSKIR